MRTTENTVLITGGGSGIGFETARSLSAHGNKVIIVGRSEAKLQQAAAQLENTTAIVCDITREEDVRQLVQRITAEHSELNILINNAGKATAYTLAGGVNAYDKAKEEITTNFLSTIRLTEALLPLFSDKKEAAIVNVSSIVAFAPVGILPTYSASKSALHSYTQTLRFTLETSMPHVKVFEVMPPLVDTEFSRGLPGEKIPPSAVAAGILSGLGEDLYEIQVGATAMVYQLFLRSPELALRTINGKN